MEPMHINKDEESHEWDDDLRMQRNDREDRMGFIRKVYGILSVQLIITASAITATKTIDGWNEQMKSPAMNGLALGLLIFSVAIECAILCCKSVARKSPTNYILLFIFTICQAFVFATICAHYPASDCITAAGMTAAVTVALTYYACTTSMMSGVAPCYPCLRWGYAVCD